MTRNNHVEAEVLAAWSEGRLPAREATAVDAHLASCDACQELLAVFARTLPPAAVSGVPWTKWHLRWAIPVAAAATVAAIWVAIPADQRTAKLQHDDAFSVANNAPQATQKGETAAATEAVAPVEEKQASMRRDAPDPQALADRAEQEKSADSVEQRDPSRAREAKERDQDVKAEGAAAAAAAPPPAQEQSRFRVEERAGLLRQSTSAEVVSPDPLIRWRIQARGRLERSTDAGKSWEPVTLPQPVTVTAVGAPSAMTAIVTTSDNRQFRTDDQGKTWNPVQP